MRHWTPAVLHQAGASPPAAIAATTIFSLGVIASPVLMAPIVDHLGMERVVTVALAAGASCILTIGLFNPPFALLLALLFGAGIGAGAQTGVNALSALTYPPRIRATGAGWALGFGRIGGVVGPLLGGVMLGHGFSAQRVYLLAAVPAFCTTVLMAAPGWYLRRGLRG
jgi:MFS transporter, AAHS family, 4-hydroxybenzoate transporter